MAELAGIAFGVNAAEVVEVVSDEAVEIGFKGLARAIYGGWFRDAAGQGGSLFVSGFASLLMNTVRYLLGIFYRFWLVSQVRAVNLINPPTLPLPNPQKVASSPRDVSLARGSLCT